MIESKHPLTKSFKFASEGILTAFKKGRNFRIQVALGILSVILGLILKLNASEWLDLTLIVCLVLILELINTAIEAIVDLISPEIKNEAKIAKDVSAASVLVASIGSIIVGVLLFLPKILNILLSTR